MANRISHMRRYVPAGLYIVATAMVGWLVYGVASGNLFAALDDATLRVQSAMGRSVPPPPHTVTIPIPPLQATAPEPATAVTAVTPAAADEPIVLRPPTPRAPAMDEPIVLQPPRPRAPMTALADSQATLPQEWMRVPRPERRAVQSALGQLGFDPGTADGSIGKVTRNAIRAYERSQGLPETGELTPELASRLTRQRLPTLTAEVPAAR